MVDNKDGLYPRVVAASKKYELAQEGALTPEQSNILFGMRCNGYFYTSSGLWRHIPEVNEIMAKEFQGEKTAFFGPAAVGTGGFFDNRNCRDILLEATMSSPHVIATIAKYRQIDEDQATRIAYLLGGTAENLAGHLNTSFSTVEKEGISQKVNLAARAILLGELKSADAITCAMAAYTISGGPLDESPLFLGNIYKMGEAIYEDGVTVCETKDMGISQVSRLRSFIAKLTSEHSSPLPDITKFERDFQDFPTVGAEFHFPLSILHESPNFWQRLALLNMSQYQKGSFIQFSRNDRNVIEVRMNPSIYPVTIANWNHLRFLMPELNRAFFTITFNRRSQDFSWVSQMDKSFLKNLRVLGMLCYASEFTNVPCTETKDEVNFGDIYLGQTVRLRRGSYDLTGNWGGAIGEHGQLGLYVGYGNNLPLLAYYLSMALAKPSILKKLDREVLDLPLSLEGAINLKPSARAPLFKEMLGLIKSIPRLNNATISGEKIMKLLDPTLGSV